MRLPDGDRLDEALAMFHDHRWVTNKPSMGEAQFAELLQTMFPWFATELAPPKRPRKRAAKPAKSELASSSTRIPSPIRSAVVKRDGWSCQRCGRSIWGMRYGLQHRRPRQMGGSKRLHTMANLVVLCGWTTDPGTCTAWVELDDRTGAERDGWLVPHGADPEDWPVLRFGVRCEQPGDEWVPSVWHPRQVEMGVNVEGAA